MVNLHTNSPTTLAYTFGYNLPASYSYVQHQYLQTCILEWNTRQAIFQEHSLISLLHSPHTPHTRRMKFRAALANTDWIVDYNDVIISADDKGAASSMAFRSMVSLHGDAQKQK